MEGILPPLGGYYIFNWRTRNVGRNNTHSQTPNPLSIVGLSWYVMWSDMCFFPFSIVLVTCTCWRDMGFVIIKLCLCGFKLFAFLKILWLRKKNTLLFIINYCLATVWVSLFVDRRDLDWHWIFCVFVLFHLFILAYSFGMMGKCISTMSLRTLLWFFPFYHLLFLLASIVIYLSGSFLFSTSPFCWPL